MHIGLVGKYINLPDAYLSVVEALKHGGYACGAKVVIDWISADDTEGLLAEGRLSGLDGIVVPGGFGVRGIEGKIAAARYAREHDVPYLGLCLGLHCAVIEFARDVCDLSDANSSEFDSRTPHPVIDLMDEQKSVVDMGGTMRLGAYPARLVPGTRVREIYGEEVVYERHRHRYELNNRYRQALEDGGMVLSGMSPDGLLVEFIELPASMHPFFVGTQAHPEFKSRPNRPHPLFAAFVEAARQRAEGRLAASADRHRPGGGAQPQVTFRIAGERRVATAGFLAIDELEVIAPGGDTMTRVVVRHPGAVVVVPVEADNRTALLVRQYRAAADRALLEVPAGKRDVDGEAPSRTGARELEEEIGVRPGRMVKLAEFYNTPGFSDEYTHLYLATDLQHLDARATTSPEELHMTTERVGLDDGRATHRVA